MVGWFIWMIWVYLSGWTFVVGWIWLNGWNLPNLEPHIQAKSSGWSQGHASAWRSTSKSLVWLGDCSSENSAKLCQKPGYPMLSYPKKNPTHAKLVQFPSWIWRSSWNPGWNIHEHSNCFKSQLKILLFEALWCWGDWRPGLVVRRKMLDAGSLGACYLAPWTCAACDKSCHGTHLAALKGKRSSIEAPVVQVLQSQVTERPALRTKGPSF